MPLVYRDRGGPSKRRSGQLPKTNDDGGGDHFEAASVRAAVRSQISTVESLSPLARRRPSGRKARDRCIVRLMGLSLILCLIHFLWKGWDHETAHRGGRSGNRR